MEREGNNLNLVLDSSVIIKWFSQEDDYDKALKLREQFIEGSIIIAVPDLQLYEIANALRYNKNIEKEIISEAVESLIDIGLSIIVPTKDTIKIAVGIAFEFNITVYDACFVALAKELSFAFVTADNNLY